MRTRSLFGIAQMCAVIGHDATRRALNHDLVRERDFVIARALLARLRLGVFEPDHPWLHMCIPNLRKFLAREIHEIARLRPDVRPPLPPVRLNPPTEALHNDHAGQIPDGMGAWSGSHARSRGPHSDLDQMRADDVRAFIRRIVDTEPGSERAQAKARLQAQIRRGRGDAWLTDSQKPITRHEPPGHDAPVLDPVMRSRLAQVRAARERAEDYRAKPPLVWTRLA